MYKELFGFAREIVEDRPTWRDGELWTALVGGIGTACWFYVDPGMIPKIRGHLGDLLSATSITSGFVLTALYYHAEAIASWRSNSRVDEVAKKLIGRHVWTIVCLLFQLMMILIVWMADGGDMHLARRPRAATYGGLVFLALYCGFQILNHALTSYWTFTVRARLVKPSEKPQPTSALLQEIESHP